MANLKLEPATPSDGPEILSLFHLTFSAPREPMIFVLFPLSEPPETAVERMWAAGPDEEIRMVKIVDEETGKIVAAAKWIIQTTDMTEEQIAEFHVPVDWHEEIETNEWAAHLIDWISKRLFEETKGKACVILDLIATHPGYQKRGLGKRLMDYGTGIADEMRVPAYIDGTLLAKKLYESAGFRGTNLVVPVPEKWKGRDVIDYFRYERPVGGRE